MFDKIYKTCNFTAMCNKNEIYVDCVNPIFCQPTCRDPFRRPCWTIRCRPGCQCRRGFIRVYDNGPCVPITTCPSCTKCTRPEICQFGGQDCATCANYKYISCRYLKQTRCYCPPGYVRLYNGGPCIPSRMCRK